MKNKTKNMILISLFTALTAIGGFLEIPIPPVPFTLQTLFVHLSGFVLGGRLAFISQIIYVLLGLMGIPIFTQGGGIYYIFKPTFGYILGFPISAYIIGKMSERLKDYSAPFYKYIIISFMGMLINYVIGLPYLYIVLKYINMVSINISEIIVTGFLIFLPWDIVKILISAYLAKRIQRLGRDYME